MSLYAQYIKEIKSFEIIEDSEGFITYQFIEQEGQKWCYIEELYVIPEKRRTGKVVELADAVTLIAKQNNCVKLLGSIVPSLANSHRRMEILMSYNFKLHSSQSDLVFLTKEI